MEYQCEHLRPPNDLADVSTTQQRCDPGFPAEGFALYGLLVLVVVAVALGIAAMAWTKSGS